MIVDILLMLTVTNKIRARDVRKGRGRDRMIEYSCTVTGYY